jgi:uncharacterized membrane protein
LAVFGIQHFIYAEFAATLVPALLPRHLFFIYLAGDKATKILLNPGPK